VQGDLTGTVDSFAGNMPPKWPNPGGLERGTCGVILGLVGLVQISGIPGLWTLRIFQNGRMIKIEDPRIAQEFAHS
jgi:hypothetical protein